jgi:pimeloyl-ACP methyl ester carboxylesterase
MNEGKYRAAEEKLFADAGVSPSEHWIEAAGAKARVLEVGSGTPLLFLTGGPAAAGQWAYLAAAAAGIRCLLLDRPGTGLSEPPASVPDAAALPAYVERLTADALDGLGLGRASLAGSSFGGYSALRSAAALPNRVERVVLLGCPAFVPGWTAPAFFKILRTPVVGALLLAAPATKSTTRASLKQMGHRQGLAENRLPNALIDWTRAWQRYTDTMRNDAAMINACGTRRHGFDTGLDLDAADLASVRAPVLIIGGTDDPVGGEDVVRNLAALLPDAAVEMLDGAGHLPWLDYPERIGESITSFLARDGATPRPEAPSGSR